MSDRTGIEWCDATWNPIVGCSVVSPGCTHCYAMRMAARIEAMQAPALRARGHVSPYLDLTQPSKSGPVWTGRVALAPEHVLTAPLRWKRPRKIFVNSMGDLFHEAIPDAWIDRVFAVMALAPQHTFIVLTKRSERMREWANDPETPKRVAEAMARIADLAAAQGIFKARARAMAAGVDTVTRPIAWPLSNVWKGVSCEDQPRADERIPDLLATPAAVRFVSAEPLLGPIDFTMIPIGQLGKHVLCGDSLRGPPDLQPGERLDWIIIGGESGNGARPMRLAWARSIVAQCKAAGVACFVKQLGRRPIEDNGGCSYSIRHTKGGDPREWPIDLRVQEFPAR